MDIALAEQIAEAQRELGLRKRLYPAWVKHGKLPLADAQRQLRTLEAIITTLTLVKFAQEQLPLFDEIAASGTELLR